MAPPPLASIIQPLGPEEELEDPIDMTKAHKYQIEREDHLRQVNMFNEYIYDGFNERIFFFFY